MRDDKLFSKIKQREAILEEMAELGAKAEALRAEVIKDMEKRGLKALESDDYRVTLVANETTVYDAAALRQELKPGMVRRVFKRQVNINALPDETRKRMMEVVPRRQLAEVTTEVLDTTELSQAVQEGKIPIEAVSKHSTVKKSAAYIRVSDRRKNAR